MKCPALVRLAKTALLVGVIVSGSATACLGQGNDDASALSQSAGGEAGAGEGFGKPGAPIAQVGAGTTNGSTTGVSGPKSGAEAAPGQNSLPPLPSPDLCAPYTVQPAYESCLWVVLREK